jgi:hypothetical protein
MTDATWRNDILRRLVRVNNSLRINTNRWRGPWTTWQKAPIPKPEDTPELLYESATRLEHVAIELQRVAHDIRDRALRLESEART